MDLINLELFKIDSLSTFVGVFVGLFTLLTVIYSFGFMDKKKGLFSYYFYIILTLVASLGVVFSNDLVLFMVFWGFLGILLYLLIGVGEKPNTSKTSKKALIIVGGADALMLLGLALIWHLTGTFKMDGMRIPLNSAEAIWAYLLLAIGAFAKAGVMPFHSWVPDTAEDALTPVTAYLPASLDKLLGIYFLVRLTLNMFVMNLDMNTFLMAVGSFTIIAAVMMALIQNDFKRLLGYLAVSSAGYMVLGLGTGNFIGIAGGLFYMLNGAICMSCLFMTCGSVEKNVRTMDLDKLGGFAKIMPITFITFVIASLAISGVPPFNGFASKWMIYQGIINVGKNGGSLWMLWLVATMFGSALTLASFMKLIHAVFLGQPSPENPARKDLAGGRIPKSPLISPKSSHGDRAEHREVNPVMWVPTVILAVLCVVFGVFAYQVPLKMFILPSLKMAVNFSGTWNATLATLLMLVSIAIGIIIYFLGTITKTRETESFVGGEVLKEHPDMRVSGVELYNTVQDIKSLKTIYNMAKNKAFDLYEVVSKIVFGINKILRYMHNGILPTYLAWCLLGMGILFYVLILR
ncbi:MAG: hypothetical protein KJ887_01365 [Candidatus Omnitrophica bacterium]|nr:hypothetical protein [Candidatus Omnitrophota bacterium]MBU1047307.1 hypothetical protein [Candidatus Omnitrophota bacterium]MBU1767358.1 hypothetical protein [Candidatus Omnitrophota bacterium]MBU1889108.1 hypothetical protein [Candidatus Omnitrophota bacterium]